MWRITKYFYFQKSFDYKKSDIIFIILSINLIGGKEQEINIELNRSTINIENEIRIQKLKINELENEIKQIKNDKTILLKRIKDLEDLVKNNELEKKINNLEKTINEQSYKIGKIYNIEKESNEQKKEIEKIKNWKNKYNLELQEINS